MASKGQKFNKYSDALREEIVKKYLSNQGSSRSLGKEYNIPFRTIDNWVQKFKSKNYNLKDNRKYSSGRAK